MARVYVTGHKNPDTDSVISAIAYAYFKSKVDVDDEYIPVIAGEPNDETTYVLNRFKIKKPELITNVSEKKIILVDHNEMGQVVDGTDKAIIFEIIDHHKIGGLQTGAPIMFHAEPVGSTCTIVADFIFYHQLPLSKELAGALLAGVLSDTVIFKSPTTTEKDKRIASKLADLSGLVIDEFGLEVKKAKSSIAKMSANDIIMKDFKEFEKKSYKYGIGQIEIVDYAQAIARKKELLKELDNVRQVSGLNTASLMVTNIILEETKLWLTGETEIITKAFNKTIKDSEIILPGVLSRKKQVVPLIEAVL